MPPSVPGSIKDWKERTNEGIDKEMSLGKAASAKSKPTPTPSGISPREQQRIDNMLKLQRAPEEQKRIDDEKLRKAREENDRKMMEKAKGLEKEVPGP